MNIQWKVVHAFSNLVVMMMFGSTFFTISIIAITLICTHFHLITKKNLKKKKNPIQNVLEKNIWASTVDLPLHLSVVT